MLKAFGILPLLGVLAPFSWAAATKETSQEYSVQLSSTISKSPPSITLNWTQDRCTPPSSFVVSRKRLNDTSWGRPTILQGDAVSFIDTNVQPEMGYEYQVVKVTPAYSGFGYIYSGIDLPLVDQRGRLLLVVDNTYASELTNELAQLEQDLVGDGWTVTRVDVSRTDSVLKVKKLIKSLYKAEPEKVRGVFLFGHVPVPYSGNIVPDGHAPDHQGAWPCDGFYGDMDGLWTDHAVKITCATDARNRNVPGDGKFDQSSFPAPLKLMVGRVDLSNMPGRKTWGGAATFPSELDLLRNYLRKDHAFRTGQFDVPRRAMLGDYFGTRDGEAFAASGWRNFSTFFGPENTTALPEECTWIPTLATNPCLFAYGCGPGTFTSIGGLGNANSFHDGVTPEIVSNDVKTVFAVLFGSWLGDWDAEDDMLRSILATPTYGLASVWSGRPHWFMHHMAMGEPIGFSTRLTQNNKPDGLYQNQVNNGAGQIQIALMGDPTLRMHIVAPPAQLILITNGAAVSLKWSPSPDSVLGYHVYEAATAAGPFSRMNTNIIIGTSFEANAPLAGAYMVRAVKLEHSASGTYLNASQGCFAIPGETREKSFASVHGGQPGG